jgi:hypothetical protein
MQDEDIKFRMYLQEKGFDTSAMGIPGEKEVVGTGRGRAESEGTVVTGKTGDGGRDGITDQGISGEEYAREVPVKAVKKGKGLLDRITGVAP